MLVIFEAPDEVCFVTGTLVVTISETKLESKDEEPRSEYRLRATCPECSMFLTPFLKHRSDAEHLLWQVTNRIAGDVAAGGVARIRTQSLVPPQEAKEAQAARYRKHEDWDIWTLPLRGKFPPLRLPDAPVERFESWTARTATIASGLVPAFAAAEKAYMRRAEFGTSADTPVMQYIKCDPFPADIDAYQASCLRALLIVAVSGGTPETRAKMATTVLPASVQIFARSSLSARLGWTIEEDLQVLPACSEERITRAQLNDAILNANTDALFG
jgi:hypothetical protein